MAWSTERIGEDMRRDLTNQFGYFVPTETEAIKNASKDKRTSIIGSALNKKTLVMKKKGPTQTPPKQKDENLKKARQLFSALCCIAGMMDCTIEEMTIKVKGDSDRYKVMGEKRTMERASK